MAYWKAGTWDLNENLAGPQKNWKTGTRVPSRTLAGLQKVRKTGARALSGTLQKYENRDPTKTGKPGPRTLEKPENRDPSGTSGKPKKWDTVPQWGPKIGKAGPNVTLEKLYYCKSTFIYLLFSRAKGDRI